MLPSFLLALLAPFALADAPAGAELPAWEDAPPATWTVVLQTAAGPLLDGAKAAREPIARLIEALPAGDRIEIVAVHTRSTSALPLRTLDEAGRAALAAEVRVLELPSAKSTDLGAGLSAVASLAPRAPGGSHFVLMLGDFCHSPPLESVYANGGYGCRTIRGFEKLAAAFDNREDRTTTEATLFPVATPAAPVHQGGVDETRAFFEPGSTVVVAAEPFAAWIDATRSRVAATRLRPLVRAEALRLALTARVEVEPTSERPTGTLVLGTGLPHLGFVARSITVEGARTAVQTLSLSPEGTVPVEIDLPDAPFSVFPASDVVDIPVRIRVDGELAPAGVLQDLGIDPIRTGLETSVVLHVARQYGLSPLRSLAIGASVLLLGAAGVLTARRRLAPLRLGGTFSYRRSGGPRQTLAVEHLADAPIVVLPDGSLGIGRRDMALLVLRVERPLWKTHATVEIRTENAEINTRPAAPGRHPVVPGATSFQFRDYRLSWE